MVVEPNKLTLQSNKGMLKKPAFPGSLKTDFLSLFFICYVHFLFLGFYPQKITQNQKIKLILSDNYKGCQ